MEVICAAAHEGVEVKDLSLAHRIIMFFFLKAFICLANGTKCKLWPICYADMFADILIHAIYGIYVYADIFADILIPYQRKGSSRVGQRHRL